MTFFLNFNSLVEKKDTNFCKLLITKEKKEKHENLL